MKIVVTASELLDRDLWEEVCELRGISVWAVNEGQMDSDHEFTFTAEEARKLGLLRS